ncbi:MAG: GNAT family N-acetyltransferase [Parasphingopyxis sp.]|uniref:GNAT family N-acetyltransferase n=1 Tax=Parasphingopyxis sp. TaxID=1920299 RepID=UPI003FA0CB51
MSGTAIETQRLILRNWRFEDRWPFAEMNGDPEVMRYFPSTLTRDESDALVGRIGQHLARHGFGLWAVERKEDRQFLGFCGLARIEFACPIEGDVEIGWRLARHCWRQGYALEAASACLEWAWAHRDFQRIVSMTADINEPSWSLMRKLGMEHRPELDFLHPRLADDSPLKPHVVYVVDRPA